MKVRTVTIWLGICAALDAAGGVAQRLGSTHPPALVTVLTAIATVVTATGVIGLSRGARWSWSAAVGGALLSGLLAVGAIINAPVGAKVGAGVILVLSILSSALLFPLRRTRTVAHS